MERFICLVSGIPISRGILIEIDVNKDVADLQQYVWKKLRTGLDTSYVPYDLKLWAVKSTDLEWEQPVEAATVEKTLMLPGKPIKHYILDGEEKSNWPIKVLVERDVKTDGSPLGKTVPLLGTRKIASPWQISIPRHANDLAALQISLGDMQIKGAKNFEQKSPKTKDTTEDSTTDNSRKVQDRGKDQDKNRKDPTSTDDKQKEIENLTGAKDEKEDDGELQDRIIVNKDTEAVSLKNDESLATLKENMAEMRRMFDQFFAYDEFNVVVVPRNTGEGFFWKTMIKEATVDELKNAIYRQHPERGDKDQGPVLLMVLHSNHKIYQPMHSPKQGEELRGTERIRHDAQLRNILTQYKSAGKKTLTLSLDSPDRPFTSFTFEDVVNLFQITNQADPIISDILCMVDFVAKVHDRGIQAESKKRLMGELESRIQLLSLAEMGQNIRDFVTPFLFQAGRVFNGELRLKSQKLVTGRYGQGTMDFVIEPSPKDNSDKQTGGRPTHVFGVVTLVRNGDFPQAMAQNLLQLEASLRWRTISLSTKAKVSYGIVTDAVDWYFVECSILPKDPLRPKFRVSALGFNQIRYHIKGDWKQDSEYILDLVVTLFGRIQAEIREQGSLLGLELPLLRSIR